MKPIGRVAVTALLLVLLGTALAPAPAEAGSATDVALGLAAFAVFNQLFGWPVGPAYAERVVVYSSPPVYTAPAYAAPPAVVYGSSPVYGAPRVVVVQPSPSGPPGTPVVVEYSHGRYELRGDGVSLAYHWVWIPKAPPPPPPPPGVPPPPPPAR
jgi:hypothetical protein